MASKLKWLGNKAKAYIDGEVGKAFDRAGRAWEEKAREDCPVDTGALKASIGYIYDQSSKKLILYADKSYAAMVELGSRYVAARPFLRPALSVIPRIFRGFATVQAPNTPEKYQAGYEAQARGKMRGAKFKASHLRRKRK